jgi:hypothetical protein
MIKEGKVINYGKGDMGSLSKRKSKLIRQVKNKMKRFSRKTKT